MRANTALFPRSSGSSPHFSVLPCCRDSNPTHRCKSGAILGNGNLRKLRNLVSRVQTYASLWPNQRKAREPFSPKLDPENKRGTCREQVPLQIRDRTRQPVFPNLPQLTCVRTLCLPISPQVEAIEIHNFCPCTDKILHELFLPIFCGIDLSNGTQFGMMTKNQIHPSCRPFLLP